MYFVKKNYILMAYWEVMSSL